MLATLTFLFTIYLIYQYRISQIRRVEAFKRKEAEYKQLVAETETAVLRLQMNPHFIFNGMNSISSYMLRNDVETANDYLIRFSSLMRMILDFAAEPNICISDEIDLLEQYLQTENIRLENRFQYAFVVDENLDPDEVLIPTMILQPFVENAIWHGFPTEDIKGNIQISFKQKEESLICIVEDNGIGRKAASKASLPNHKSKAISITLERLKLLEKETGKPARLEIIDLTTESGNAAGTRVELHLPLI